MLVKEVIKTFKEIKKELKSGVYDNHNLKQLKSIIDHLEVQMAIHEEDMSIAQAEICWDIFTEFKNYTRNKYSEYDDECKLREEKAKEWEKKMEKEGKIFHLNF